MWISSIQQLISAEELSLVGLPLGIDWRRMHIYPGPFSRYQIDDPEKRLIIRWELKNPLLTVFVEMIDSGLPNTRATTAIEIIGEPFQGSFQSSLGISGVLVRIVKSLGNIITPAKQFNPITTQLL